MSDREDSPRLRHGARAIVLDPDDRVLLLRAIVSDGATVWITPGGGIEEGESPLSALRRELLEEVGLRLTNPPAHAWHQRFVASGHIDGYDGVVNDFFLVRTGTFVPEGTMTQEELRAELIHGHRWWSIDDIRSYAGSDIFAPRQIGELLGRLLRDGPPSAPVPVGR